MIKKLSIKKLAIVALAASALAFGTIAAVAEHHSPEKRLEHMKKALNLTDAQTAQIKTIYENNKAQFKSDREALKAAAKGSDAKKTAFQKMRADREAVQAQIVPVLTADQQTKWQQLMAKHEHRHEKDGDKEEAAPQQK